MLTQKQKQLLVFIHERMQEAGVPPSFDEMKDALELKSKSGIHRLITALVERGFIRRLPHRARAIEVIKLPDDAANVTVPAAARTGFTPSVIEGSKTSAPPVHLQAAANAATIPMMGRIAAGVPISAIQDHSQDVACPPDLLGKGRTFCT